MGSDSQSSQGDTASRSVAVLGPQHESPVLRDVLDRYGMEGPYVLVAAGWEEREAETGALENHLGAPVENLAAWPACEAAFKADDALKKLMFDRYDRMRNLSRIYRVRLSAELAALRDLLRRTDPGAPDDLVGPSLGPAFEALRALDAHHAARVEALNDETFAAACKSPALERDRERMRDLLSKAGTLLIAGGHVGILYNRMRLFGVVEHLHPAASVCGWSAGGMVLTDNIMLFHDSPPRGAGDAEVHGPGFGLAPGLVALPHAASRLRLDDGARVALLAERMSPRVVTALDSEQYAVLERGASTWSLNGGARQLRADGLVVTGTAR